MVNPLSDAVVTIAHVEDERAHRLFAARGILKHLKEQRPDIDFRFHSVPTHGELTEFLQEGNKVDFIISDNSTHHAVGGTTGAGLEWLKTRDASTARIPTVFYTSDSITPGESLGVKVLSKESVDGYQRVGDHLLDRLGLAKSQKAMPETEGRKTDWAESVRPADKTGSHAERVTSREKPGREKN